MSVQIDTPTARKLLTPRDDPYFQRLEQGAYIGYRKLDKNCGTWVARWRNEEGKNVSKTLGTFDTFDLACKAVRDWIKNAKGGVTEVITVEEACKRYVINRRIEKGDKNADDAEGRFNRTVYGKPIGRIKLSALKTSHIVDWRNARAEIAEDEDDEDPDAQRRAKDTANRYLTTLKAALNLAYRDSRVSDTAQWDRVKSFEGVSMRRERFLTLPERKKLLLASSPHLDRFVRALLLTAARPGEIANCKVGDFDKSGLLTLDGKIGRRTVPIAPQATKLFIECSADRDSDAPLLTRKDGKAWTRFDWRDEIKDARTTAGLGDDVVAYTLRHVAITEMIVGKIDPLSVAKLAGTSIAMIHRYYGHLMKEQVAAQLAKVKVI